MVDIAARTGNNDNNAPIEPPKTSLIDWIMLAWVSDTITRVMQIATIVANNRGSFCILNRLYVETRCTENNVEQRRIPPETSRRAPENSVSILETPYSPFQDCLD